MNLESRAKQMSDGGAVAIELLNCGDGAWRAPGARIIDRTARKRLPIGDDGFERAAVNSVLVDKTALISDVLDSGYTVTLFCRPRRFGKTLNMTMLKAFFESGPSGLVDASLFEGAEIWEKDDGAYRSHFAAYPVIYLSMAPPKVTRGSRLTVRSKIYSPRRSSAIPISLSRLQLILLRSSFSIACGRALRANLITPDRCCTLRASCEPITIGPSSC